MGELVDEGYSIALSPEGTRSTTGQLNHFKQGAGAAAVLLRLPVIPIYLKGTGKILPKGSSWPKKGKVTITIGKPLIFSPQSDPVRATQEIENFFIQEKHD